MSSQLKKFQRKIILAKVTQKDDFFQTLIHMQPGEDLSFAYRSKPSESSKLFKVKVISEFVDGQYQTFLVDPNDSLARMKADDVFAYANLPLKINPENGLPIPDKKRAQELAVEAKEGALEDGANSIQAEAMKQSWLEWFNNNPFKRFLDRFKKSRDAAKNAQLLDNLNDPRRLRGSESDFSQVVEPSVLIKDAKDALDEGKLGENLEKQKNIPDAKPIDEKLPENASETIKIFVESELIDPSPSLRQKWQAWRKKPKSKRKVNPENGEFTEPSPVEEQALVTVIEKELPDRASNAESQSSITPEVAKKIKEAPKSSAWTNRQKLAAGVAVGTGVAAGTAALTWYLTRATLVGATAQHQEDLNGCWMYNELDGTKTKVKLLSCGTLDLKSAMETCTTQAFPPASGTSITKCPDTVFNPCVRGSKSRSSDSAVPLVPNVCDAYVYKGDAPSAVSGVKLIPACLKEDGTALPAGQSCSPYCRTANFNLPSYLKLMCINVDFNTAFVDLVSALGYDPDKVFPPLNQPQPPQEVSKPLLIATIVLGALFLLVLGIYWFKN